MQTVQNTRLTANIQRILHDIHVVANAGTSPPFRGCTRHSYSEADHAARAYLQNIFRELDLTVSVDGVGNVRARMAGRNAALKPVLVGSHIDTVTDGGRLDGLLGVICAIEVVRTFRDNQIQPERSLEIVIFAEEEGSNFGVTLLGSKSMVSILDARDLHTIVNEKGENAHDLIRRAGYEVDAQPDSVLRPGDVAAMLELHIEQGGVLEHIDCPIGIVQSIAGMRGYKIVLEGVSNHAGSTPMYLRHDPLLGASEIILKANEIARQAGNNTAVATVGKVICHPNASNAICGKVELYVDIRDVDEDGLRTVSEQLLQVVAAVGEKYVLSATAELIGHSDIVRLSPELIGLLCRSASALELPYHYMNSGAVHDAVMMTTITKVGMIFVPSISGLSHCPQEDTRAQDIQAGCNLLIEAVHRLTRM